MTTPKKVPQPSGPMIPVAKYLPPARRLYSCCSCGMADPKSRASSLTFGPPSGRAAATCLQGAEAAAAKRFAGEAPCPQPTLSMTLCQPNPPHLAQPLPKPAVKPCGFRRSSVCSQLRSCQLGGGCNLLEEPELRSLSLHRLRSCPSWDTGPSGLSVTLAPEPKRLRLRPRLS